MTDQDEVVLYEDHPAMFRNHPVYFIFCVLLIPVGLGLTFFAGPWTLILAALGPLLLLIWWIQTLGTTLTVTNEQTTLRKGILSKHTNDVFHSNVRNIQVRQSFLQRMLDVGWIGISSAGQATVEIEVNGMPDPHKVKEIIDDHREG